MEICKNKVSQYIPTGTIGWREIELPCGSIGMNGNRLMCEECIKEAKKCTLRDG